MSVLSDLFQLIAREAGQSNNGKAPDAAMLVDRLVAEDVLSCGVVRDLDTIMRDAKTSCLTSDATAEDIQLEGMSRDIGRAGELFSRLSLPFSLTSVFTPPVPSPSVLDIEVRRQNELVLSYLVSPMGHEFRVRTRSDDAYFLYIEQVEMDLAEALYDAVGTHNWKKSAVLQGVMPTMR